MIEISATDKTLDVFTLWEWGACGSFVSNFQILWKWCLMLCIACALNLEISCNQVLAEQGSLNLALKVLAK